MTVTVNGNTRPLGDAKTLAGLLAALNVKTVKKAVELNGQIIPASAFANTPVKPNDQIEIIQFVGGG
ncbi:MAG: sulfur carrier protein ThiS [Kiritimatiellae bacterium]|nr:sulfur carrier protein ThiS [Kiritimatiellia bacterium]